MEFRLTISRRRPTRVCSTLKSLTQWPKRQFFLQHKEISKAQEEIKKGEQLRRERKKHILLADKSGFSWVAVHEYKKHELADNSEDEKRIFKSEIRAKAKRKQNKSKLKVNSFPKPRNIQDAVIKQPKPAIQPDSQGLHLRYPRYGEDPDTGWSRGTQNLGA